MMSMFISPVTHVVFASGFRNYVMHKDIGSSASADFYEQTKALTRLNRS